MEYNFHVGGGKNMSCLAREFIKKFSSFGEIIHTLDVLASLLHEYNVELPLEVVSTQKHDNVSRHRGHAFTFNC